MSPEIIVILALVAFAGALLRAGWLVLKALLNRLLSERLAQHQQYTTLICTRLVEKREEVRNGRLVIIESVYELPQEDHFRFGQVPQQIPRIGNSPLM